ncbi:cytochrome P450, partial [Flammula alnicola]
LNYTPGFKPLFSPVSIPGVVLPHSWWNPGYIWAWKEKQTAFFNYSHDLISMVPLVLGDAYYYTCSIDVLKQLLGNEGKVQLLKPGDLTLRKLWGDSVASASGDIWRRHRRVVAPAFNPKTYTMVRRETADAYLDMIEAEGWNDKDEVIIPVINKVALRFSLIIVSRCLFDLPVSWSSKASSGDQMPFTEAISIAAENLIPRIALPQWAYRLPIQSLRRIDLAWSTFDKYVEDCIQTYRSDNSADGLAAGPGGEFLRRLVASSEGEGRYTLSDKEVLANLFIMMFSGHETTASVISATLALLAVNQENQENVFAEIQPLVSEDGKIAFDEIAQLPYITACFQESLRLYPAPLMLPREMLQDTPVHVMRPKEETRLVLKKGTRIIFEMCSIFRNPHVFDDPHTFKPERWLGVPETDVALFGAGPRTCVGRKFAYSEGVSFLAHLLHDWKIEPHIGKGETRAQFERRVLEDASMQGPTFSIGPTSLKLVRRVKH